VCAEGNSERRERETIGYDERDAKDRKRRKEAEVRTKER